MNKEIEITNQEYKHEIWKPVQGFKNYIVSSLGRLFNIKTGTYCKPGKSKQRNSYCTVFLYNDGVPYKMYLHRLVLMTFKPTTDLTLQVDHINLNKSDNRLCNLRWCTFHENMSYYKEYLQQQKQQQQKQ